MKIGIPQFSIWFILLSVCSSLNAQSNSVEGLWVGKITIGGIYSEEGYPFELYLTRDGKRVHGRSYIYLDDSTRLEMDMWGTYFRDRSIYFEEVNYVPVAGQKDMSKSFFFRRYQLMYKRSIWESTLNGFWQDRKVEKFGENRKRGRVFLKKAKEPTKA